MTAKFGYVVVPLKKSDQGGIERITCVPPFTLKISLTKKSDQGGIERLNVTKLGDAVPDVKKSDQGGIESNRRRRSHRRRQRREEIRPRWD